MAKKKASASTSGGKATAKAAKKAKAAQKIVKKEKKKATKSKDEFEDDDEDLEAILAKMQKDWEDAHKVTEELVEGPPSGEFFDDDNKAHFYNDVFRYSPEKNEWRKFVSQTCPGPRSAHAVVASPAGGGKLFLFGGEFSSLHQTTFHHYRDFWCFDITTHTWDRIDTKIRPTARSGHRMAIWKHYVVLYGGFYDPGPRTNYLGDLWIFDTQEYHWKQVQFKEHERKPSVRSGFSFLPSPEGILLHGGYCKEYKKGSRPVGVMLDDTWFLKMTMPVAVEGQASGSSDLPIMKWERRKRPSTAYAPSLRSGCTMALWQNKNTGILFGGVTDEDTSEETLESIFHNDLYGYQIPGNGRWISMALKRPKKKGGAKKKTANVPITPVETPTSVVSDEEDNLGSDDEDDKPWLLAKSSKASSSNPKHLLPIAEDEVDPDDPNLTIPLPRYNAMLAVQRNTLFVYGGIFERGSREYTLDDFYSLQLDKLDKYVCLKANEIDVSAGGDESSSDEEDGEGDDGEEQDGDDDDDEDEDVDERKDHDGDDDGETVVAESVSPTKDDSGSEAFSIPSGDFVKEEVTAEELTSIRAKAAAFVGVSKDAIRSEEDILNTPLPGETVAKFYARSRDYWAQIALESVGGRGKTLRRDGFSLAQQRYKEYRPIQQEVEKILAEAGLDEEEIRTSAAAGPAGGSGTNRNRR